MFVSSITIQGEDWPVTVYVEGPDVRISDSIGVPWDADDVHIWDFCGDVLNKSQDRRIGPPTVQTAEIYNLLQPLFELAQANCPDEPEEDDIYPMGVG